MSKRKLDEVGKVPPSHEQVACGICKKSLRRDALKYHFKAKHPSESVRELGQSTLTGVFYKPSKSKPSPSTESCIPCDDDDLVGCGNCKEMIKRDAMQSHFDDKHPAMTSPSTISVSIPSDGTLEGPSPAKIPKLFDNELKDSLDMIHNKLDTLFEK